METERQDPGTRAECIELSRAVLACLDRLSADLPEDEAHRLRLAAAHLHTVIELLDEVKPS